MLLLYKVYGASTLLVLNGTSLNSDLEHPSASQPTMSFLLNPSKQPQILSVELINALM